MTKCNNKKGIALIYTLVVILLLDTFAICILVAAVSNRTITASMEKSNKLKYAAKSGIDIGIAKLKDILNTRKYSNAMSYLVMQNGQGDVNAEFNIDSTHITDVYADTFDDGIGIKVTAKEIKRYDPKVGNDISCIDLNSVATNKDGMQKKVDVYLDERDMTNVFYHRIFNYPYTVSDSDNFPILTNPINPIQLTDDRGSLVSHNVKWMDKSTFNTTDYYGKGVTDEAADEAAVDSGSDTNIVSTKNLYIMFCNNTGEEKVSINDLTDYIAGYVKKKTQLYDAGSVPTNTCTSIEQIQNTLHETIPGYWLTDYGVTFDPKFYNYKESSNELDIKKALYLNMDYSKYFKMIVIDGDAEIDESNFSLINYIIYCTGTLKIKIQDASKKVKLFNSSLVAKNIKIDESSNPDEINVSQLADFNKNPYSNKNSQFMLYGIQDLTGKEEILAYLLNSDRSRAYECLSTRPTFPNEAGAKFIPDERARINDVFSQMFGNYYTGYRFRIVEWKEE